MDVFVGGWDRDDLGPQIVAALDASGMRAVGDVIGLRPDVRRLARIIADCSAVVCILERGSSAVVLNEILSIADSLGVPVVLFGGTDGMPVVEMKNAPVRGPWTIDGVGRLGTEIVDLVAEGEHHRPLVPYAFYVGRLERDFAQARWAIESAVELELGIPCVRADDVRHETGVVSVREQTQVLIEHAALVVADLTLGVESPHVPNPSRAHEIGMAVAYDRPVLLTSQEPRRHPYFSIGDRQMMFWETEAELHDALRLRLRPYRETLGRSVLNHCDIAFDDWEPRLGRPTFVFDEQDRYFGPHHRPRVVT